MRTRIRLTGVPLSLDYWFFLGMTTIVVVILLGMFLFLGFSCVQTFSQISPADFFLNDTWNPDAYGTPSWGILSLLMSSLIIVVLSIIFVAPLGLAVAIYLSELASPRVREIVKPLVEMIAGIPTVVFGLLGLLVLAPAIAHLFGLPNGLNALTASILVGIAALPTVASICEDALSNVPESYRETSLALGATQWETIRKAVIPAARSGIAAGLMLGVGRIVGETMVVLMVGGNNISFPLSPLDGVRTITANLAIETKDTVYGSLHWHALFATGFILFIMTFVVDFVADYLIHRSQENE